MDDLDLGATIKGFSPGQKVFNRFTLERILGRGGMGVVWLARDEDLERQVALKFLPEIVALDRESVTELKRETRRNLELTHPHIVRIYDFVQDARSAAISMEFVNGSSLSGLKVDRPGGIFSMPDVTRWAGQLCEALSYAHGTAKVVHRDLKPANLMITTEGDLKITDFGIACSISDSVSRVSKNMDSSGTPLYMSPQQMMGDRPTAADDIYSFGATVYELLAGKPPFYTGNIILQVQNKQPPTMAERRQELHLTDGDPIPAEWETVIAACLMKDPAERPPSIAAVAERLKLSGSFTAYTPSAPPPPVPKAAAAPQPAEPPAAAPKPAPAPVVPSKPVNRKALWLGLAAGLLVMAGLGYWLGDVPNRFKAGRQMAEAQKALFASDWQTALLALREAVNLRPTDLEYRREFDEAQRRWLDMVEKEIAGAPARVAYDRLTARAPAAVALVEPYSETFRRLTDETTRAVRAIVQAGVDDSLELAQQNDHVAALARLDEVRGHASVLPGFAAAETTVRRSRVVHGIESALAQSGQLKFPEAYAMLELVSNDASLVGSDHARALQQVREEEVQARLNQVGNLARANRFAEAQIELGNLRQNGVLLPAVEAVAAEVKALAEDFSLNRLSAALVAAQVEEADAALQDYARFTDSTFTVTGAELVGSRDLEAFLQAIEQLRMRPASGQPRAHGRDIALVAAVRTRFADGDAVTRFLRREFSDWSEVEEKKGRPGLALYLAAEAQREGAPADNARLNRLKAALAADVGLRLAWSPDNVDTRAGGPLRTDPLNAVRTAVERRVTPIMRTGGTPGAGALAVALTLSGPTDTDQPTRQRRSSRYQSGTRTVDNPRYGQLQSQLDYAEDEVRNAQRSLNAVQAEAQRMANQASSSGDLSSALAGALAGGIGVGVAQNTLNKAVNNRNNIRNNLRNTPRTLSEPTYADEPYDVITHNVTYAADLTAVLQGVRNPVRWRAQFAHQTIEVNGNSSRGVPVQTPTYPAAADINRQLAQQLVEQTRDLGALEKALALASFTVVAERGRQAGHDEPAIADDQWGLVQLWRSINVEPDNVANIESGVRSALGLPRR
ncbi:MAG: serine/threonine protein kinase [Opitutaceae bacterium]|nr:serine/threonine protein kinase [Opitutaceae bacterium]